MERSLGGWVPLRTAMRALGWGYTKAYNAALAGEMGAEQLDGGRWYFRRAQVLKRAREMAGEQATARKKTAP